MTRVPSPAQSAPANAGATPSDPGSSQADLLDRFQAVAEETRFRVVRLLSRGERCVCELQVQLGVSQSLLSFHLKKLKDAGVVAGRRQGRWVYYSLVPEALEEMRAFLGEVKPSRVPLVVVGKDGGCCS